VYNGIAVRLMDMLCVCPDLTKEECEAYGLIQRSFCRFFLSGTSSAESAYRPSFFRQFPCGKEVTSFGIREFT